MYLPSIVVVALGEPGTPVVSCAITGRATSRAMVLAVSDSKIDRLCFLGGPQDFERVEFASAVSSVVGLCVLGLTDMTGSRCFEITKRRFPRAGRSAATIEPQSTHNRQADPWFNSGCDASNTLATTSAC